MLIAKIGRKSCLVKKSKKNHFILMGTDCAVFSPIDPPPRTSSASPPSTPWARDRPPYPPSGWCCRRSRPRGRRSGSWGRPGGFEREFVCFRTDGRWMCVFVLFRSESEIMIQWQPPAEEAQNGDILGWVAHLFILWFKKDENVLILSSFVMLFS